MEDQPIGENNEHRVHTQGGENHKQAVDTVDVGVGTSQLHNIWMQAVRVGKLALLAVRQFFQHDGGRNVETNAANHNGQAQAGNPRVGEDGAITQRTADGHNTIKSHGQQHRGLHDGESMNKEKLGKAHV